jgi:hypothetical protein
MIVFLTSIRHPQTSNNFLEVEQLLETTVSSILAQTDPEFRVIIVCNQVPRLKVVDARIVYHKVEFPAPPDNQQAGFSGPRWQLWDRPAAHDKGTKLLAGLLLARRFQPQYVFIIDADDWVHRAVVHYLHSRPRHPVWYADGGYFVDPAARAVKRKYGMVRYCGSTFAYDPAFLANAAKLTRDVDENSSQEDLMAATSGAFIQRFLGDHQYGYKHALQEGVRPRPIRLPSVCWVGGTGAHSPARTRGSQSGVPIDRRFCEEFGLPQSYISTEKSSTLLRVREACGSLWSRASWIKSRVTGRYTF